MGCAARSTTRLLKRFITTRTRHKESGFKPLTDTKANGTWDVGEPFQDLNGDGIWNNNIATTWVKATQLTQNPAVSSIYPREWRFDYMNIPASGAAIIQV